LVKSICARPLASVQVVAVIVMLVVSFEHVLSHVPTP
jgi:hypothetical protein